MKLTPHFSLEELTVSETAARKGLDNYPKPDIITELTKLALFLEDVRTLLGQAIQINSGYRSPEVNTSVGGSKTSQHCKGQAADIRVKDVSPDKVMQALIKSDLQFDQLIREYDSWTHISIADKPRRQALIIDKSGTRPYTIKA
tara:strand:- start:993 stop:1424 length:432 start_codon:yes stop_codon:yes gene_type:complete